MPLNDRAHKLTRIAFESGALKINTRDPFTWTSGYRMPVYNDNRRLLGQFEHRLLVAEGMQSLLTEKRIAADVVAGVATAGIPHATTLANLLGLPLIYVRDTAKSHGMKNRIEGPLQTGQRVVVVEDLVSTGGSSIKAVNAVREAGGVVEHCLCILTYEFPESEKLFNESHCRLHALLPFNFLIAYAREENLLTPDQQRDLREWLQSPFQWGGKHGFPKIDKTAST